MGWCPKCRNEYVEGITVCPDCNIDLTDELPAEENEMEPAILEHVSHEQIGAQCVLLLQHHGLQTAGLMPVPEDDETYEDGFYVVVASFEREAAVMVYKEFDSLEDMVRQYAPENIQEIEKDMSDLQEEEANIMLTELRTESSSVYVKKKDKYTDLKFSGISFIIFSLIGAGLLAANYLEYINMFNTFSSFIMAIVFLIFLCVGITSLLRAKKMKNLVSQEEKVSDEILLWIEENITDEWIDTLVDSEESDENNYFHAHGAMCQRAAEQFPLLNANYIDQLMDERYNEYCENKQEEQ